MYQTDGRGGDIYTTLSSLGEGKDKINKGHGSDFRIPMQKTELRQYKRIQNSIKQDCKQVSQFNPYLFTDQFTACDKLAQPVI